MGSEMGTLGWAGLDWAGLLSWAGGSHGKMDIFMGTRGAQSAEAGPRHSGRKSAGTTAKYMLAIYLILSKYPKILQPMLPMIGEPSPLQYNTPPPLVSAE